LDTSVIERLLETYFRRPVLYLVPLVLCLAFGAYSVVTSSKTYISEGVLSASGSTLLGNLSDLSLDSSFGTTPASVASDRINEQLRSDDFVVSVAERSGMGTAVDTGVVGLDWIRARVGSYADGENLLKVRAGTTDPVLSQRLATATIDTFIQSVVDEDLRQSGVAAGFYDEVAAQYQDRVDEAEQELADYLAEHPEPAVGSRPAAEQSSIDQLTAVIQRDDEQLTDALAKAEEARLATEQARIDIEQRLRVVDPPVQPTAPVSGLRAAAMSMVTFGVLGAVLTAGVVIVAAFLDRTVRTTAELRSRLGFDVFTDVPAVNVRRLPRQ
jgi:hypothetical protein